jgi:GTP-binding protein Era
MDEQTESFKSGFVTLVGKPNVGKSTLMNYLLRQKIAAVSPKPQTTRRRQLGILTTDTYQMIFEDTPGIHAPLYKLGEYMVQDAFNTITDADVVVWMVDASQEPNEEDLMVAEKMEAVQDLPPVLLALNKADLLEESQREPRQAEYLDLLPQAKPIYLSALHGEGSQQLIEEIVEHLPEGPKYFDEDQVTDLYERDIAADLIREAALQHLREEVPHSIAVRIDEYKDRDDSTAFISATLLLNRESHKGIVIGRGGTMLKTIGSSARHEIEALTGRTVFLELHVKVSKNWRNDPSVLRSLGYTTRK